MYAIIYDFLKLSFFIFCTIYREGFNLRINNYLFLGIIYILNFGRSNGNSIIIIVYGSFNFRPASTRDASSFCRASLYIGWWIESVTRMALPRVFMDLAADGSPLGRIVIEVIIDN